MLAAGYLSGYNHKHKVRSVMIKVVNTITGEIMEFESKDLESIIVALTDLKGLKAAIERAEIKLKGIADELLGDEKGYTSETLKKRLERRVRASQEYSPVKVRQAFDDDDLFMSFVKIGKTDLDNWRKEALLNGELSIELSNALNDALDYSGKSSTALYFIDAD